MKRMVNVYSCKKHVRNILNTKCDELYKKLYTVTDESSNNNLTTIRLCTNE